MRFFPVYALVLLILPAISSAGPKEDIKLLVKQGRGTEEGRAAWDRLVEAGPEALPVILKAMPNDIVASNWLRTAFDRIIDREVRNGGKSINVDTLLAAAKDSKLPGRARRLALEVVEELRPGTSDKFYPKMLDDPEFRYEAVDLTLTKAEKLLKNGKKNAAKLVFRKAFEAGRDMKQLRTAAKGLSGLGVDVSVGRQMGFLMDWYVVGPFDAKNKKGFKLSYPPEKSVDLSDVYQGKDGKIRWGRFTISETPNSSASRHQALVSLRDPKALGDADDAVGYGYTEITVPKAIDVELRGAGDDNISVWVNGKKAFGFEEYQNGVRHDRHRFKAKLRSGKNKILVKVCQAPPNIAPNWEFMLRIADTTGKGVAFEYALPKSE